MDAPDDYDIYINEGEIANAELEDAMMQEREQMQLVIDKLYNFRRRLDIIRRELEDDGLIFQFYGQITKTEIRLGDVVSSIDTAIENVEDLL